MGNEAHKEPKLKMDRKRTYKLNSALSKLCSPLFFTGRLLEVAAVRPPADRQQHLEVTVAPLEQVQLLQAPVQVRAAVIPAVVLPVDVRVRPLVRQVDLARLGPHVGERVQNVRQLLDRQVLGPVLAAIDSPVDKVGYGAVAGGIWTASHGC